MWTLLRTQELTDRMKVPLLTLYFAGKISGRVRFQKLVFLCMKEAGVPMQYDFKLHKFGPFANELSRDLQDLTHSGMISAEEITWMSSEGPSFITVYSLTKNGKTLTERKVLPTINEETRNKVQEAVQRYNSMPLNTLLSYVYSNYT